MLYARYSRDVRISNNGPSVKVENKLRSDAFPDYINAPTPPDTL